VVWIWLTVPGRAAALGLGLLMDPVRIMQASPLLLLGLGIGGLLAWMRVR
jgi:hypothetical protein